MSNFAYRERTGRDDPRGAAIKVGTAAGETGLAVMLELGVMRAFGSMSADAWAELSPSKARDLAYDLQRAAAEAERGARQVERPPCG